MITEPHGTPTEITYLALLQTTELSSRYSNEQLYLFRIQSFIQSITQMATTSLYRRLKPCLLECPLGGQQFLPPNILDETITKKSVKAELPWKSRVFQSGLPGKVSQQAKKVFAILVLIGEPLAIKELLLEGLTDEHLPLSPKGGNNDNILVSVRGKTFQSFVAWRNDARVADFLEKQWLVQAPVLDTTGKHVILDPKCALPFPQIKEIGGGDFSIVYKSALHPAYQQGFKAEGANLQIAIKEFRSEKHFSKEKENLEQIQNLHHQHLIQHLATYEIGQLYYVIFPWADGGNLREFWTREDSRQRTPELALWSLRQMLGLAGALKALHSVNCRHGDLKPENILHFKEGGEGVLVIADVGVSKVHEMETKMRRTATSTRATTPSYEAPEVYLHQKMPLARRYDIWSIGCIFLEFTIWLLHDFETINSFGYARDAPEFSFYKLTPDGTAETHPVVSAAIDALRQDPRCKGGTALEALVSLIAEHLLQVKVDRRHTADEVHDKLRKIVQDAEKTPSYLFNRVDPPPAMPLVVRHRVSVAFDPEARPS